MVSINDPGDLDLSPFDLKLVCESHQRWVTFILNLGTLVDRPSGSRVIRYVRDGRTDRQTD